MSDLTLEECKGLADRGLPQELKTGDRFRCKSFLKAQLAGAIGDEFDWYVGWVCAGRGPGGIAQSRPNAYREYYKIPSLEELMEFAKTLTDEWVVDVCKDAWVVALYREEECWYVRDTSLIQAVYKLIEKHFEEVQDDEPGTCGLAQSDRTLSWPNQPAESNESSL